MGHPCLTANLILTFTVNLRKVGEENWKYTVPFYFSRIFASQRKVRIFDKCRLELGEEFHLIKHWSTYTTLLLSNKPTICEESPNSMEHRALIPEYKAPQLQPCSLQAIVWFVYQLIYLRQAIVPVRCERNLVIFALTVSC